MLNQIIQINQLNNQRQVHLTNFALCPNKISTFNKDLNYHLSDYVANFIHYDRAQHKFQIKL